MMKRENESMVPVVFLSAFCLSALEILLPRLLKIKLISLNYLEFLPWMYLGMAAGALAAFLAGRLKWMLLVPLQMIAMAAGVILIIFLTTRSTLVWAFALPFVFLTWPIAAAFRAENPGRIFAADLGGIAAGILFCSLLMGHLGLERLLLLVFLLPALIPLLAAARPLPVAAATLAMVALTLLLPLLPVGGGVFSVFQRPADPRMPAIIGNMLLQTEIPGRRILDTRWTLLARSDLVENSHPVGFSILGNALCDTGQCLKNEKYLGKEISLYYDGIYFTSVHSPAYFRESFGVLGNRRDALIIGLGGGGDVIFLKSLGTVNIDAAEINTGAVDLLRRSPGKEFSEHLKGVNILPLDGRTVVRYSRKKYDLIHVNFAELYMPFPNSRIYMETYLYTEDAMREYWNSLKPDGVFHASKFSSYSDRNSREVFKLVITMLTALKKEGIPHPENHIALIGLPTAAEINRSSEITTLLVTKREFTPAASADLRTRLRTPYRLLYAPHLPIQGDAALQLDLRDFISLLQRQSEEDFFSRSPEIRPATDEKPFFYSFDRGLSDWEHPFRPIGLGIFACVVIAAAAFLRGDRGIPGALRFSPGFILSGAAFGIYQCALLPAFYLFLGNPIYSMAVNFAAVPVIGGVTAWLTRDIPAEKGHRIWLAVLALNALTLFLLPVLLTNLFCQNLVLRLAVTCLLLAPAGVLSGIGFPLLMRLLPAGENPAGSLLYVLNLLAGVIGIFLALPAARQYGYSSLLFAAPLLYLLTILVHWFHLRKRERG